jgi:hypothetical protein
MKSQAFKAAKYAIAYYALKCFFTNIITPLTPHL